MEYKGVKRLSIKTVILCGGKGTRLGMIGDDVPKPLVSVGGLPLLRHIMKIYLKFGFFDFVLPLGFKGYRIKQYLKNQKLYEATTVRFGSGVERSESSVEADFRCTCVETGVDTLTVDRLLRCKSELRGNRFFLTYGDGVSDVDIRALERFHLEHGRLCTVTAVRPPARFGKISFEDDKIVSSFNEKTQLEDGWINGGYMIFEEKIFDLLPEFKNTMLEDDLFDYLVSNRQLAAFKHFGFWQCVDTMRDLEFLNRLVQDTLEPPWIKYCGHE